MTEKLYYQDCGVLGGRSIFDSGAAFETVDHSNPTGILNDLMQKVLSDFDQHKEEHIYTFTRFAICLIHSDDTIDVMLTAQDEDGNAIGTWMDHVGERRATYKDIDMILTMNSIQLYDIFQETEPNRYEQLTIEETETTEKEEFHWDNVRCLDLFGCANAPLVEKNDSFHHYMRWNLGADFYIEALDNDETEKREFWICRDYRDEKYLFDSFDPDDTSWKNLFDRENKFIIDQNFAAFMCDMSDLDEYFYIDNYYQLVRSDMGNDDTQLS